MSSCSSTRIDQARTARHLRLHHNIARAVTTDSRATTAACPARKPCTEKADRHQAKDGERAFSDDAALSKHTRKCPVAARNKMKASNHRICEVKLNVRKACIGPMRRGWSKGTSGYQQDFTRYLPTTRTLERLTRHRCHGLR